MGLALKITQAQMPEKKRPLFIMIFSACQHLISDKSHPDVQSVQTKDA